MKVCALICELYKLGGARKEGNVMTVIETDC